MLLLNLQKFHVHADCSDIYQQFHYSNSASRRNTEIPFFKIYTGRRLIAEITRNLVKTCKGSMYISRLWLIFKYHIYFIAESCRGEKQIWYDSSVLTIAKH